MYGVNALFAFSYNVGDTHVFYLPSHLMVALLVAPGLVALGATAPARGPGTSDRCDRRRGHALRLARESTRTTPRSIGATIAGPSATIEALTAGLDDRRAILLTDLNWQVQNGLSYFGKEIRPALAYARMPDVLLYAPVLVRDNLAIDREVVATERAQRHVVSAYGPLLPVERDARVSAGALRDLVDGLAPGTRYALCVLKPTREFTIDGAELAGSARDPDGRVRGLHAGRRLRSRCGPHGPAAGAPGRIGRALQPRGQS